ncbi:MAG: ATP-dependent Clp protease ATP-binding subunit [Verrucomicrobiae bacterium]|nr:ATP-dependent Clp protease ATP-binding subunit [Verrucomicrobiae bacterium]
MKEAFLYYGPKKQFILQIPSKNPITTISDLAIYSDKKMREHVFKIQGRRNDSQENELHKKEISNLVGFSDQYATLSESAIQGFLSFINQYEIDNLYLQNPPIYIVDQLQKADINLKIEKYTYSSIDLNILKKIYQFYSSTIIGQEKALSQILTSIHPLCSNNFKKPIVMLFYGPTGVGKSETAQFISKIMNQKIMRKQFSMFHGNEFASYLFGGRHSQPCLARDLMERESNVILFDEFDKPNPSFYSAFYQFFDEGIYEDKNYHTEAKKSIIICTSNFKSEKEAQTILGAPLFARFSSIIQFKALSKESIEKILNIEFKNAIELLNPEDKDKIQPRAILDNLKSKLSQIDNCRQIQHMVRDAVSRRLLEMDLNVDME